MTYSCLLPAFDPAQAAAVLREKYGLEGTLTPLAGERDLNFLLTDAGVKYVFKIANHQEAYGLLECQHQVFEILAGAQLFPQQARSLVSLQGKVIEAVVAFDGTEHYCRVLPFLEGRLMSGVEPLTEALLADLGNKLALLDQALAGFEHAALERPLLWKMDQALKTLDDCKPLLNSGHQRELIEHFETGFRSRVSPLAATLPQGVIHNDANDNNLLVEFDPDGVQRISSIIDFGDMVLSWRITEPAVAAAYAMLGQAQPLETAATIIRAYHAQAPLDADEISVLFDLIAMRLCMSVCICAYQRGLDADNAYLSISETAAWALLEKLRPVCAASAQDLFRAACGSVLAG